MTQPNMLLIVMDDMKSDLTSHLPQTNIIAEKGVSFLHRLNTALCQVYRTTMFTGQWSKDHNVYGNTSAELLANGWTAPSNASSRFNHTIARALSAATPSYWCGLIGKEMNFGVPSWDSSTAYSATSATIGDYAEAGGVYYRCILSHTNHVPPNATYWVVDNAAGGKHAVGTGWNYWRSIVNTVGSSYGVPQQLSIGYEMWDGTTASFPAPYYLDYLYTKLQEAYAAALASGKPWFIEVAVTSPHTPLNPKPEDNHGWEQYLYEFAEETNFSLRPSWIQGRPALGFDDRYNIQDYIRRSLREAQAVDRFIRDAVALVGGLANTDVFLTNDNSVHAGDQRRKLNDRTGDIWKNSTYDAAEKVHLVCAGPSFPSDGRYVNVPTSNIDIPATIMAIGNVSPTATVGPPSLGHQHGVDLRDVAVNPGSYATRQLLHQTRGNGWPDCDSISTLTRKLNHYIGTYPQNVKSPGNVLPVIHNAGDAVASTDQYEIYALDTDPNELHNRGNDSTNTDPLTGNHWAGSGTTTKSILSAQLVALLAL